MCEVLTWRHVTEDAREATNKEEDDNNQTTESTDDDSGLEGKTRSWYYYIRHGRICSTATCHTLASCLAVVLRHVDLHIYRFQ